MLHSGALLPSILSPSSLHISPSRSLFPPAVPAECFQEYMKVCEYLRSQARTNLRDLHSHRPRSRYVFRTIPHNILFISNAAVLGHSSLDIPPTTFLGICAATYFYFDKAGSNALHKPRFTASYYNVFVRRPFHELLVDLL